MKESNKKPEGISFFFPAYFDEKSLPRLVSEFHRALERTNRPFEIIIIDDGSPDNTGKVADELAKKFGNTCVIHHPKNQGYGQTLADGFSKAKKPLVGFTDGDAQYSVEDLDKFLDAINDADMVIGYRTQRAEGPQRRMFQRCYKVVVRLLFGLNARDIDCGYKVMRTKIFQEIKPKSTGGFFSAELIYNAQRKHLRIKEVPVRHLTRPYGRSTFFGFRRILHLVKEMLRARLGK